MRIVLFFFFALLSWPAAASADTLVVISIKGEQRLATYRLDEDTGKLTHLADTKTKGEPGNLTSDPGRKLLFVAMRSTGELASFRIEPATGKLSLIAQIPGGDDPAYVALDRTGNYLLTAYYVAAKVTVHKIAGDGKLSHPPLQSIATARNAHAIVSDPSNRFVFVPHTGANAIFQFRFDAATGKLTANDPPRLATPEKSGPRHLVFHPSLPLIYADNEQGGSVTSYEYDRKTGLLSKKDTVSTLPADFKGENSTAEIKLHPKGDTLYVSNRGHDSIAVFRVGPPGRFRILEQTPTEKTPRSFDVDPSGRWLFAAGEGSGKVAGYRIDKLGRLTRVSTVDVGREPWCILAMKVEAK